MKKILSIAVIAPILAVGLAIGFASAHVGTKPDLSCTSVSSDFTSFPDGTHSVTFVVNVDGTITNVPSSFTGTSGTASADISSLTTATGELNVSAYATWTDDGGGQTDKQEVTLTCHTKPVTPPETPKVETPVAPAVAPTPEPVVIPNGFEGK